jgi:hypothetical protein
MHSGCSQRHASNIYETKPQDPTTWLTLVSSILLTNVALSDVLGQLTESRDPHARQATADDEDDISFLKQVMTGYVMTPRSSVVAVVAEPPALARLRAEKFGTVPMASAAASKPLLADDAAAESVGSWLRLRAEKMGTVASASASKPLLADDSAAESAAAAAEQD